MRIVGGATPDSSDAAPPAGLSVEQWENAKTIASVGRQLGVGARGIKIALMTALVESGLRNVNYGDRDSVGVFQQRAAWGPYEKRMNVADSARMFFLGGEQGQRGLLDFSNWRNMDPGAAAQAVQVSANPDLYGRQSGKAGSIVSALGGVKLDASDTGAGPDGPMIPMGQGTAGGNIGDGVYRGPVGLPPTTSSPVYRGAPDGTQTATNTPFPVATQQKTDTGGPLQSAYDKLIETAPDAGETGALGSDTPAPLGADASNKPIDFSQYASEDPELDLSNLFAGPQGDVSTVTRGSAPDAGVSGIRSAVLNYARSALGTPYVFGGNSPSQGLDCSGLVKWALEKAGIKGVPRLSARQAQWAGGYNHKADDLTGARPGDLITWGDGPDGAIMDHIAFYIGNNQILEEPRTGLSARIIDLSSYYKNLYGGFHIVHMGKVYGD